MKTISYNHPPLPSVPFYYIRHGQTDWNKEHRFMGQTDIPLNAKGFEQAHAATQQLHNLAFTKIIASPLQRAQQTAQIIGQAVNKPIITVDELKESFWGSMEGQRSNETLFHNWRQGATVKGIEPWADFVQRIGQGLQIALQDQSPVLIVSHGGVYWAVQEILGLAESIDLSNCCPVFHQPPRQQFPAWQAYEVGQDSP